MIRVVLPSHLRALARIDGEVRLDVAGPVTQRTVLDALEARYPALAGTIRGHGGGPRRAFIRFFACRTCPTSRPTPRSPRPSPPAPSLTSSSGPWPAVRTPAGQAARTARTVKDHEQGSGTEVRRRASGLVIDHASGVRRADSR
jgi:sulfur-carrier protein